MAGSDRSQELLHDHSSANWDFPGMDQEVAGADVMTLPLDVAF